MGVIHSQKPGSAIILIRARRLGPVEPGRDGEAPGDGRGFEPADLLHPPDVQLQVRPPGGQRVQATLSAPGEVTAEVGLGVLARRALEAGQLGRHGQPWLISKRRWAVGTEASSVKFIMI